MAGLQQPFCDHENRGHIRPFILELLDQGPQIRTILSSLLCEETSPLLQQPLRSGPLVLGTTVVPDGDTEMSQCPQLSDGEGSSSSRCVG